MDFLKCIFHYKPLADNDAPGGMVGRIYRYERSGPCGFGEDFYICFPNVNLWELMTPGWDQF